MVRIFVNHVDTYTGKALSKVGCRKKSEANDVKLLTQGVTPFSSHVPKIQILTCKVHDQY